MLICPIRHHSPAAALQVERLIRERRPRAVLVEGPSDATDLIPLLLDEQTSPPVALYAYRQQSPAASSVGAASGGQAPALQPQALRPETRDAAVDLGLPTGRVQAAYYPFCDYSPEYVALRVGQEVGAQVRFCDVPAAAVLQEQGQLPGALPPAGAGEAPPQSNPSAAPGPAAAEESTTAAGLPPTALPGFGEFAAAIAAAAGFESFEEFWEASFEQDAGARPAPEYVALLETFGRQVRALSLPADDARDARRERHMAAAAREVIRRGVAPEDVLLVCGAAHADAIAGYVAADAESLDDAGAPGGAGAPPDAQVALIPFSFPRLSEHLGYGAGNRAPWYYQQVWRRGGDYLAATRYSMLLLARHLRAQGQSASLAQCIDAYVLAQALAGLRAKRAPGVDELREAAVACFGQGAPAAVSASLRTILTGDQLGRITPRVGRTPLQAEFYATAQGLGLPVLDSPRQVLVHLVTPREAAQSVFLHRLTVADIPFGREMESGLGGRGRVAPGRQGGQGGALQQLARVREKWELQWTPATDGQLIERTAWGSTLVEVCRRLLDSRLAAAERIDSGTEVLLRLALCDLADALPAALARCEALAADSASFPALARATYHLDGLLSYGAARQLPAAPLAALAMRLFARASLHLPAAVVCSDDAAREVQETLLSLHDLAQRRSPVAHDPDAFWTGVETVAQLPGAHPQLRGVALVLLELGGRLAPGDLAARLRFWLSRTSEAADNARLVAGLFALHRGTLVRNRALVGAVTDFLRTLSLEQLTPLLPVLRRSLGSLSAAERSYLTETLAAILGVSATQAGRALRITSADAAVLREVDAAVATVMAGWKTRYGIE